MWQPLRKAYAYTDDRGQQSGGIAVAVGRARPGGKLHDIFLHRQWLVDDLEIAAGNRRQAGPRRLKQLLLAWVICQQLEVVASRSGLRSKWLFNDSRGE